MIEVIGALLGFLGGIVPDMFGLWREKRDREHELAMLTFQMKHANAEHAWRMEEIGATADVAESKALYRTFATGIRWVDALNGTVRPTLAYAFFGLYLFVKVSLYGTLDFSLPWAITAFWDEYDRAFLFGVLSYYFGQRGMSKTLRRG